MNIFISINRLNANSTPVDFENLSNIIVRNWNKLESINILVWCIYRK
jgi:hypothetical protein